MNDRSQLLEHMNRETFLRSVREARLESEEADVTRDHLERWAGRILPYLNANPDLTIAQAIDLYNADHGASPNG